MADVFTKEKRSWIMRRVGPKDTKPEKAVRSFLHRRGFRFRLHRADLPGHPDIVLPRYRAIVLVHGCFWHSHRGCPRAALPTTNRSFWRRKIAGNKRRDRSVLRALRKAGWRVFVVWACEIRNDRKLLNRLRGLMAMSA